METTQKHKGLGDTIAAITEATGLDKLAKKAASLAGKEDCGCAKRRELLNKVIPYSSNIKK